MIHAFFREGGHSTTLACLYAYWSFDFWCALCLLVGLRSLYRVLFIMDNGIPLAPSFTATCPIMPTQFMGMNPPVSYNGMQNYDTQFAPWASSQFSIDMPSSMQSSPWSTYMNPSIGSGGTMALMPMFSFDMSYAPHPAFTTGGWNLSSYGSNPSYSPSRANT